MATVTPAYVYKRPRGALWRVLLALALVALGSALLGAGVIFWWRVRPHLQATAALGPFGARVSTSWDGRGWWHGVRSDVIFVPRPVVRPERAADLRPLRDLERVVGVNLYRCAWVTDAHLAEVARLDGLHVLEMESLGDPHSELRQGPTITAAGLAGLARLKALEDLGLHRAPIGDEATTALATIGSLRDLDLSGTGVTDAGLPPLARLTRLARLDLDATAVTPAGIARLQQALPDCEIVPPTPPGPPDRGAR